MLPQVINLEFLEELGFKKSKGYSPQYNEIVDVWIKEPKIKKRR